MRAMGFLRGVTSALMLAAAGASFAADYPERAVTIIVPFAAGGGVDSTARLVANELSKRWNQPVVVVNRPGANGAIGATAVANAAADGHTLLVTATGIIQNFAAKAPNVIDPFQNFTPVSQLVNAGLAFVLSPAVAANTLPEFANLVKTGSATYSYASFGTGSSAHFAGEALSASLGGKLVHVPFQGEAPSIPNIMAGQVTSGFISVGTALQLHRAGKVRMVAVVGRERSKLAPDTPTFAELGYKGLDAVGWVGMFAPKATPAAIVNKIGSDAATVLSRPSVIGRAVTWGHEPLGSTPQEFERTLRADFKTWESLSRQFNITLR